MTAAKKDNITRLETVSPYPAPEPLGYKDNAAAPYPVDALGDYLANMARLLHEVVQAPLALCGQSVLMSASLVAQGYRNAEIDGRTIPLSLFALTIAESGERKSGVYRWATAPINALEKQLAETFREDLTAYRLENEAYLQAKANIKAKLKKTTDPDELTQALKALGTPPPAPKDPVILPEDPTIEGMTKHLARAQPCAGIFTDEGAAFFGGHSMGKEKAARTVALYSRAWDGSPLGMMRSNEDAPNFKIYNRRIAMHLMLQPVIVREVFNNPLLIEQGFIPRFLIAYPPSAMGTRFYNEASIADDTRFKAYFARLLELLENGWHIDPDGGLDLLNLTITGTAKQAFIAFSDEVERQLHPNGDLRHISGTAAKIAEQSARIAGVLTFIKDGTQAKTIAPEQMRAGITLARYSLAELLRLKENATIAPEIDKARALLGWVKINGLSYLYQNLMASYRPRALRAKQDFEQAARVLVEHGYLLPVEPMELNGSLRKEVYRVLHTDEPD
ncbi:YfjI family protein [Thiomicrorhabdus cannonii]|uniref:YfjI family protein n=1 Tax=Thiomicrorhabdus cannonii TaxID=2748011 RepID=UPI0015BBFDF9|nr:YfjI family protein [Thiomicrorhabdus cannonii]